MHIALISSIHKPTTLDAKGGQEVWAAGFALEAIKRGHTIDLYGIKGSLDIPGQITLHEVLKRGDEEVRCDQFFRESDTQDKDMAAFVASTYLKILFSIKEKEQKYDLIIDGTGNSLIGMSWTEFNKPLIIIGHFPIHDRYVRFYTYFALPKHVSFVFVSKFQYEKSYWISDSEKYIIPNGIDLNQLPFIPTPTHNHLVWMGRVDLDMPKGIQEAITVATTLQQPLDIYTYVENDSQEFYTTQILPQIKKNPLITVTKPPQPSKKEIFQKAKMLLFPTKWEEPFGLVMLEAMATGTPVVAFAKGAIPEIVRDGVTGFIVNTSDEDIRGNFAVKKTGVAGLCEAVQKIYEMSQSDYAQMRKNTREHVKKHFSLEKMVDQYEKVFAKVVEQTYK